MFAPRQAHQGVAEDATIADVTSLRAHSMHADILRQHPRLEPSSSLASSVTAAASRRLTALDRHARFVNHLQRFKTQKLDSEHKNTGAQRAAADKLRAFTDTLRQAILGDADVTLFWKPAANAAALKAKREQWDSQDAVPEKSWASASAFTAQTAAIPTTNKLAVDMSQLVDSALSLRPDVSASSAAVEVTVNSLDDLQSVRSSAHDSFLPATASAAVDSAVTRCIPQQSCDAHPTSSNSTAEACSAAMADPLPAAQFSKNASISSMGGKRVQKPAWALTANAANDVEQEEEEELLAFAGGLEFDKYIAAQEDAELQDVLQDLRRNQDSDDSKKATLKKHVVRAINHAAGEAVQQTPRQTSEADAASVANQSDGAASTFSRHTALSKSRLTGKVVKGADSSLKWETSTKAGSDVGSFGKSEDHRACEDLLRQNPEMKQVHSVASAAALLRKAGGLSTGSTDVLGHEQYWKARA